MNSHVAVTKIYYETIVIFKMQFQHENNQASQIILFIYFKIFIVVFTNKIEPTRLLCPWDFPGKDTGVGCHFLLQGTKPLLIDFFFFFFYCIFFYHGFPSGSQPPCIVVEPFDQLQPINRKRQESRHTRVDRCSHLVSSPAQPRSIHIQMETSQVGTSKPIIM